MSSLSVVRADAIVIGGGPSGLAVSHALFGLRAYYQGKPFFSPDIEKLCKEVIGSVRSTPDTVNYSHLSLAFDHLNQRGDITFQREPLRTVEHVVLTSGDIGGSWNEMDPLGRCLSPSKWMTLPGFDWTDFNQAETLAEGRPFMKEVADYYKEYAKNFGLVDRIHTQTVVHNVERVNDLWRVHARRHDQKVVYEGKALILASGKSTKPRRLGIDGEDFSFISHRMPRGIGRGICVIVIGSGVAAAECATLALKVECTVYHIFKTNPKVSLRRFDKQHGNYQDCARMWDLMNGKGLCRKYIPLPDGVLTCIEKNGKCAVTCGEEKRIIEAKGVFILIGSEGDLSYFPQKKPEDIEKERDEYTYRVAGEDNLYAVGPLAGDNFVKMNIAGCLAAANEVCNELILQ